MQFFFKRINLLVWEREEWRGKEGERNIRVREKYWWVASCMHPDKGLNPQPRHVPWLGIEPVTICFVGQRPTNWASLVRAPNVIIGGAFERKMVVVHVLPQRYRILKSGNTMTQALSKLPLQHGKILLASRKMMSHFDSKENVTPMSHSGAFLQVKPWNVSQCTESLTPVTLTWEKIWEAVSLEVWILLPHALPPPLS